MERRRDTFSTYLFTTVSGGRVRDLILTPFLPPGISAPRPLAVRAVQRPPRAPPWVPEVVPRLPWAALMSSTIASAEYRTFSDALALREPLRAVLPCSHVLSIAS